MGEVNWKQSSVDSKHWRNRGEKGAGNQNGDFRIFLITLLLTIRNEGGWNEVPAKYIIIFVGPLPTTTTPPKKNMLVNMFVVEIGMGGGECLLLLHPWNRGKRDKRVIGGNGFS